MGAQQVKERSGGGGATGNLNSHHHHHHHHHQQQSLGGGGSSGSSTAAAAGAVTPNAAAAAAGNAGVGSSNALGAGSSLRASRIKSRTAKDTAATTATTRHIGSNIFTEHSGKRPIRTYNNNHSTAIHILYLYETTKKPISGIFRSCFDRERSLCVRTRSLLSFINRDGMLYSC